MQCTVELLIKGGFIMTIRIENYGKCKYYIVRDVEKVVCYEDRFSIVKDDVEIMTFQYFDCNDGTEWEWYQSEC